MVVHNKLIQLPTMQCCTRTRGRLLWMLLILSLSMLETSASPTLVDVTASSGVSFRHDSGIEGQLTTLEITGAGVGILDVDNDGWMDIWLVQSGPLTNRGGQLPHDRLYINQGSSKSAAPAFRDESVRRGIGETTGYGMGIATGDVNNDGHMDVLVTSFGENQLWINTGGRFERASGSLPSASRWSISASFSDLDADGRLDLFVGNYLSFDLDDYEPCRRWSERLSYCAPGNFEPQSDQLLFQEKGARGDRMRFVDVSTSVGLDEVKGGAMGVIIDDLDGDARPDIYVANDGVVNHLWINEGSRKFREDALMAGAAVNADGVAEASMGIAVTDIDDDGDVDLLVSHDMKESNTLYINQHGWFSDDSNAMGLAADSLAFSAFGIGWLDVDNDGDLDLFVANGAVSVLEPQEDAGIAPPLRQRNQLYLNDRGRFTVVPGVGQKQDVSRGLAFGDLDNDGDTDLIVSNNHGAARIYRNETPGGNWLGLDIQGNDSVNAIGTLVWREVTDGAGVVRRTGRRRVHTDGSYASASDPRVLYGLGKSNGSQFVVLAWGDGREERFGPLAIDQYHQLRYGHGIELGVALGEEVD